MAKEFGHPWVGTPPWEEGKGERGATNRVVEASARTRWRFTSALRGPARVIARDMRKHWFRWSVIVLGVGGTIALYAAGYFPKWMTDWDHTQWPADLKGDGLDAWRYADQAQKLADADAVPIEGADGFIDEPKFDKSLEKFLGENPALTPTEIEEARDLIKQAGGFTNNAGESFRAYQTASGEWVRGARLPVTDPTFPRIDSQGNWHPGELRAEVPLDIPPAEWAELHTAAATLPAESLSHFAGENPYPPNSPESKAWQTIHEFCTSHAPRGWEDSTLTAQEFLTHLGKASGK